MKEMLLKIILVTGMPLSVTYAGGVEYCEPQTIIKKEVKVVEKIVEIPYYIVSKAKVRKNRISLLGGIGPDNGLSTSTSVINNGLSAQVMLDRTPLIGVQYQRLVTERVSVGILGLSNETGMVSVGWEW